MRDRSNPRRRERNDCRQFAKELRDSSMPSRTSVWAAAARAMGAREPDARARNPDWMAERLLGPEELALLGDHPLVAALAEPYANALQNPEMLGGARILIPRTRFIDDRLSAGIDDGITQVLILGAGFDSRAYRFADRLRGVHVFEVDQPDTQQVKIRRVMDALGELPRHVTYLPVDFRHDNLGDALTGAGYQSDRKTFAIWEGVTMYLPGNAVRDVLRWYAGHAAPGSTVVFDYTYDSVIRTLQNVDPEKLDEKAKQGLARFRRLTAGEPWLFGLPDKGEEAFLRELGLELRTTMGMNSAEAVEHYLTRADGTIFGSIPATDQQGYLILEAVVLSERLQRRTSSTLRN
jgi:methyltransferase (TIGR00027 family)